MWAHFRRYPLFVLILLLSSLAMLGPGAYAAKIQSFTVMQSFFSSALLGSILAIILGIAMMNRKTKNSARSYLLTILLTYALIPIFLAVPVVILVPSFGPFDGYFEMLSSLTTTGATLIDDPLAIAAPVHLWRATVGWLGGLMFLIIAFGVMEPMNIGGFEIRSLVAGSGVVGAGDKVDDASDRIVRYAGIIGPVYFGATALLALLLILSGDRALVATIHAMSTMATSGISSLSGMEYAGSGHIGEAFILCFLVFAISHRMFLSFTSRTSTGWILRDIELSLALILVLSATLTLIVHHWIVRSGLSQENLGDVDFLHAA